MSGPQPKPWHTPRPIYPALARRRGWEGTVILQVEVGADGAVNRVNLQNTSGYRILDLAALDAVQRWRFHPGIRNGLPQVCTVLVPVRFVLNPPE